MTLKEKSLAIVGYLLSCTLAATVWLGIAGMTHNFLELPALAPFFQVGHYWLWFYDFVTFGVLYIWALIPFKYDRDQRDALICFCISPLVAMFVATGVVLGIQGIIALPVLLGSSFIQFLGVGLIWLLGPSLFGLVFIAFCLVFLLCLAGNIGE